MRSKNRQAGVAILLPIMVMGSACTGTAKPISASTAQPSSSASTAAANSLAATPMSTATHGAVEVRGCSQGSVSAVVSSPQDATAGPLSYSNIKLVGTADGLASFYAGGQVPDGPEGSKFYKMGTIVKAGATVTVSVAPSARPYLRLQGGRGLSIPGETAFTFQACPGSGTTQWVGGFDIIGPMPACVALDVQVTGEPTPRHLDIPFGGTTCNR